MVDWIEFDTARSIVEYGPGTGVVTDFILSRLRPGSVFFSIERNPKLAAVLRRRHPGLNLVEDSAANINTICRRHGVDGVDAVLSGLPWASFPESLQVEILDATFRAMKPRAQFVTFAYQLGMLTKAGRRFRKLISSRFSEVTPSDIVWRNLPPAFVYRCRK
ncbi:MAG: ribosomal RNA adenine dimethylase domain-containing protein [Phycisphaerae bacterium]|nr:ribosomal RNA adenine dimethylase domain-containing protein [Phycisphaerae bacterium]